MSRPKHELSEVISLYGAGFELKHAPAEQQRNVLKKLSECRTSPLGGHVDACDGCGTIRIRVATAIAPSVRQPTANAG